MTWRTVVLAIAVLVSAAAILTPITLRTQQRTREDLDADAMRRLYVGLAIYEQANFGVPAPDLLAARPEVGEQEAYESLRDPFLTEPAPFPIEPGLPRQNLVAPFRISYAYLLAYPGHTPNDWISLRAQPRTGLLASVWAGEVERLGPPFEFRTRGHVVRVNVDGSVIRSREDRSRGPILDPRDVFGHDGRR